MKKTESDWFMGVSIRRFHSNESYPDDDIVANEEPLEIRLNGEPLLRLMRLPGDDGLLAAGFCLSEGLVSERTDIETISISYEDDSSSTHSGRIGVADIRAKVTGEVMKFKEARVAYAGCGNVDMEFEPGNLTVSSEATFPADVILKMPKLLLSSQEVFRATGGTHGAGLFDTSGKIMVVKEDVRRHNAVDKVLGYLFLSGEESRNFGLVISGRPGREIVLRAAGANIPLICSVSAPTSSGVKAARVTGITLIGFLRGSSFNIYSCPERVRSA
ncbi:MAG: formate dehydrogenase accessory sulfurtransferase FdhD [Actinomycetota bacterium]|nr:formate dehydrogenase accessory sulfurtransferase FdhD [Actinomycetota bacterium]